MYSSITAPLALISIYGYYLQVIIGVAVPDYRFRTSIISNNNISDGGGSNNNNNNNSMVSIDFRRATPSETSREVAKPTSPLAPINNPEARCDSHVYTTSYIQRTLQTITELRSINATAGNSGFPEPYGNEGQVMIYPLLRSGEIFDGTDGKAPGLDRIAVGMSGLNRYSIFTVMDEPKARNSPDPYTTDVKACEYIMPQNATIIMH